MSKKIKRVIIAVIIAAVLAAACVIAFIFSGTKTVSGIVVGENTHLTEASTIEEFNEALSKLIDEYDDELVISGAQSTNRLLLVFEGDGIDLSAFPAAEVIADEDNYIVIQFENEEDAAACLETLKNSDSIVFIEEDEYSDSLDSTVSGDADTAAAAQAADSSLSVAENTSDTEKAVCEEDAAVNTASSASKLTVSDVPYTSSYTGYTYYTWGVEYLGLDVLAQWIMTQSTQSVTVAVIDSGIEVCEDTKDRVLAGTDATGETTDGLTDTNGHGTHVSGTILDCTQGLEVYVMSVRVFDETGTASTSVILQGIKYAASADVDVINMSLGAPASEDSAKDYYIAQAVESGKVVVVSAGNEEDDTDSRCPAHLDECIVVGACDSSGTVAYFSNYGSSVDVCAPGVDILSYYLNGTMETLDGTSMAAPHISALAAMLRLYLTQATPEQIENYIKDYCIYAGDELYYGEGIPWAGYFAEG